MVDYPVTDVSPDMSFLEMLDVVNEELQKKGEEPIAFDSDCREGICGMCSLDDQRHAARPRPAAPRPASCTCAASRTATAIIIEPWRAGAFPAVKDLVVDRSAFDRIIQAGGFVSVNTGGAQDGNNIPVPKVDQERAMDAAACIGCGACVAACKNASAMLFVAAKVSHLAILPQGQPERQRRVLKMVAQMDAEGFGNCTNQYECEAACPKEISVQFIAQMNRDYLRSYLSTEEETKGVG